MTDKELKKLSRRDLLEMLIEQGREIRDLRQKNAALERALRDRSINLEKAGSIAEAALALNGVFEAAEAACKQYTDSIAELSFRQESICSRMEAEGRGRARVIIEKAEKESAALRRDTAAQCELMIKSAKEQSQKYWDEVSSKLNRISSERTGEEHTPNAASERSDNEAQKKKN